MAHTYAVYIRVYDIRVYIRVFYARPLKQAVCARIYTLYDIRIIYAYIYAYSAYTTGRREVNAARKAALARDVLVASVQLLQKCVSNHAMQCLRRARREWGAGHNIWRPIDAACPSSAGRQKQLGCCKVNDVAI